MASERPVSIPLGRRAAIAGDLAVPRSPSGLVIFAHGSGSTRRSARNRLVAAVLQQSGLATLLIDLLVEHEDTDDDGPSHPKWDIDLLSTRLARAEQWTRPDPVLGRLPVGYFGASTGAAAALAAAARRPPRLGAVVSRGGRPDLALDQLGDVEAPTLLIVGGRDTQVLELNRRAVAAMRAEVRLEVIEGATHLFPETGAIEQVAQLAANWFTERLTAAVFETKARS